MKKEGAFNKKKRAQVTIFVILGLVLLVMVMFILFAASQIREGNEKRAQRQTATNILDSAAINYHVQTCLDSSTTRAIDEIMIQGGVLYTHQNGTAEATELGTTHLETTINFDNDINITTNVTYSLTNTENNNCPIINHSIPQYPKANTRIIELFGLYDDANNAECFFDKRTYKDLSGFFGQNNLTRLCTHESNNADPPPGYAQSPCQLNWIQRNTGVFEPPSIEELIQKRTKELLDMCVNFDLIQELQGTNIELDENEEVDVKIIFNKNTLAVKATYPFIAQFSGTDSELIRKEFNYASPLRVVRLHNYAISLLAADAKDPRFNLYSQEQRQNYPEFTGIFPNIENFYDPNFEIKIIPLQCPSDEDCNSFLHDRILIVKDKASHIGGRYLTFATALQNRRPALDIISQFDQPNPYNYDILVGVGEELIINPQGYDPDDRNLTYNYSGWKETYDEICSITDDDLITFDCNEATIQDENKLTNSLLFEETKRAVNYTTNHTDVGLHTVRVSVRDAHGLNDYQDVKILVFNMPETDIETESIYTDLPANTTSIEDPITLKGNIESENEYEITYINYTWTITNETNDIIIIEKGQLTSGLNKNNLSLPQNHTINNTLLQTIHKKNLTQNGIHNITLSAIVSYPPPLDIVDATPFTLNLNVKQCVPYHVPTPAYPYNDLNESEIFLGNHSCCLGNITNISSYQLADTTNVCYSAIYYGAKQKLKEKAEEQQKNESFTQYEEYSSTINFEDNATDSQSSNNVFKMIFERKCDGIRGNICAGPITAKLSTEQNCLYNSTLQEQCTGPPTEISSHAQLCIDYGFNQTFEKVHNIPVDGQLATGTCITTTDEVCSTIGPTGYGNDTGLYGCTKAFCSDGGCTYTTTDNDYCSCSENCDAQCGFGGAESLWENYTCYYGDCEECEFNQQQETMCKANNAYCYNATNGFCHYEVSCESGGAMQEEGEFCQRERLFKANITIESNPNNYITAFACKTGTQDQETVCSEEGECGYDETLFRCINPTQPQCDIDSPKCCFAGNCLAPTLDYIYSDATVHNYIYD
ncbi:MAG: hypothetical protein ACLFN8_03205 [Candidatus Woesearchaeota archaeon]